MRNIFRHTAANTVPDEECDQVSNLHSFLHSSDSSCAEIFHNVIILMNNIKNTKSAPRLDNLHPSLHSSVKHTDTRGVAHAGHG